MREPKSLREFFVELDVGLRAAIEAAPFDATQRDLLLKSAARCRAGSLTNPLSDPLALFYLVVEANDRELDQQGGKLAVFLQLYLMSLALFDDVQDEDLEGTHYSAVGPAIATNSALALLFLALNSLRQAMDLESESGRRALYLKLLNDSSLVAVAGQHCDLLGHSGARTPAEVLAMQQAKTSTPSLLCRAAAIYARCDERTCERYQRVGENLALLAQLVDDVRDIFGKQVSPDLATGKVTYPLACFADAASATEREHLELLRSQLPGSLRSIRRLLHDAGSVRRVAVTIEGFRRDIHREIVDMGNFSPAHRTLLFMVNGLASMIYSPPELAESDALFRPESPWHVYVRDLGRRFVENMSEYGVPPLPPLVPWHYPHWMYDAEKVVVYYPDIEGQPEETLELQAQLMGVTDLDLVREVAKAQAPAVVAHELFHYWRDATGNLSRDMWREEYIANSLALSYCQTFEPDVLARVVQLTHEILTRPENELDAGAIRTLEGLFSSAPGAASSEYGMSLHQMSVVQVAMVRRLADDVRPLSAAVERHLTACGERAA